MTAIQNLSVGPIGQVRASRAYRACRANRACRASRACRAYRALSVGPIGLVGQVKWLDYGTVGCISRLSLIRRSSVMQ